MVPDPPAGGEAGSNDGGALIFVSDASAEAERLTTALRERGYPVVDVPLGLLLSRVSVQRPGLILCDADAAGALDTMQRVREPPGAPIAVLFLGEPGHALAEQVDAFAQASSAVFERPVDEVELLNKVEALIGPPNASAAFMPRTQPGSRAPVLVAATRRPYRYDVGGPRRDSDDPRSGPHSTRGAPSGDPSFGAASSPDSAAPEGPPSSAAPSLREPAVVTPRGFELPQAKISSELESLLASAERRVQAIHASVHPPSDRISPEAELEAVLPQDVLEALDEPLDFDDEDDSSSGTNDSDLDQGTRLGRTTSTGSTTGSMRQPTGDGSATAEPGSEAPSPESQALRDADTPRPAGIPQAPSTEPPATPPLPPKRAMQSEVPRPMQLDAEPFDNRPTHVLGAVAAPYVSPSEVPPSRTSSPPMSDHSTLPPGPRRGAAASTVTGQAPNAPRSLETQLPAIPAVLGKGDAVRTLARVVRARYSGALAFEDSAGIRRVVFRDGDFVTAASGGEGESLVEFLAQRGDLREDVAQRLVRKLPQFGRHAGAALIAQGHLRQDELWPVLRAHAEWLVARVVGLTRGAASLEHDVPLRLQAEPAVFGGATGAEVLVEIIRRAIPPDQAMARLGGMQAMLERGEQPALVGECALAEAETELVSGVVLEPLEELLRRAGSKDFASVLYALVELGVLSLVSGERRPTEAPVTVGKPDPLDHEALRARISSRKALMEEGDYFALLGVSRSATSYDIRRAYVTLKDELEPSRILTGDTTDLHDDLLAIREVLDEAYEILGDELRRERYRRALEAAPR